MVGGARRIAARLSRLGSRVGREAVASPRHGLLAAPPIVVAAAPPRRVAGLSERAANHAPPRRKRSPEQEASIRTEAGNRSLRELAADFGVSHETVRAVLRQGR